MTAAQDQWNWTFRGYETVPQGNRPVQEWYDRLPVEAKDQVADVLGYLQHLPVAEWKRPTFAPLEDKISEIRFKANQVKYRIYGYFGPTGFRQSYTFLHGTDKKVSNDKRGKKTAKDRMDEIERGIARTHEFEFEDGTDPASAQG